MAEVTTTLVVNFVSNGGAGSVLTAELDGREDGFNGGKTQFTAGDQPVFLVFKTDDVTITSVEPSTGLIQPLGAGQFLVEQDLQFGDSNLSNLTKPINGSFLSSKWLGKDLGSLALVGQTQAKAATDNPPAVNRVTYNSQFQAYRLTSVSVPLNGEASFPVVILIKGQN